MINQRTSQENKKDLLILVDETDKELGYKSKSECHQGEGSLHRAFSVFIFDNLGQLLIQKRASSKPLWDSKEIDDWKFIKADELEDSIRNSRENYTPWMKIEWETINNTYKNDLKNITGLEL